MYRLRFICFLYFIIFITGCSPSKKSISDIQLFTIQGQEFYLTDSNPNMLVLFFLSPECPLCENYSETFNQLYYTYKSNFSFYAVFPGNYYTLEKIKYFKDKYQLELPVILDKELVLTKAVKASVTPEVFVLDTLYNTLYHGAIDNRAISLGKKRAKITEHYLIDALEQINNEMNPDIIHTKAIGCYIEYK